MPVSFEAQQVFEVRVLHSAKSPARNCRVPSWKMVTVMNNLSSIFKHRAEFLRALRANKYEVTPGGIYFPCAKLDFGGHFETAVNGRDIQIDPNIVPTEGLQYIIGAALGGVTPSTGFYLAPFSGNVTPTSALTAATFSTTLTEFIQYTVTSRLQWVAGAPVSGAISNSASPAAFTMATGVANQTLYGAGLLTSNVQNGTTGSCVAATLFSTPRTGLNAGDVLTVQYTLSSSG